MPSNVTRRHKDTGRGAGTLETVRRVLSLASITIAAGAWLAGAPALAQARPAPSGQALVSAALANELRAAQDLSHPMRYQLVKSSPRFTSTREIYESRDGDVARLLAVGGQPLSPADEAKEQARLAQLLADPARQRHRKQSEDADRDRALKVLRALPSAFVYTDEGPGNAKTGPVERFIFRPNPAYSPADLETQVLVAIAGELWIDPAAQRVVRLEGHLSRDVDFGWGILGRLNKGGWIRIDQAEVSGQWRTIRFEMKMSGRVVWKPRVFDTVEEQTQFAPLPPSMTYREAIAALESGGGRGL